MDGTQTYVVKYHLAHVANRITSGGDDHVELFWNVTGNETSIPTDRVTVTVHAPGRRRAVRWVVWAPELGLLRPPGLDLAGPGEMVSVAGCQPTVRDELVELLHEVRVRPERMLQAIMATLELPGTRLVEHPELAGELPGAVQHQPDPRHVGWFDDAVKDSVRLRRELGALS